MKANDILKHAKRVKASPTEPFWSFGSESMITGARLQGCHFGVWSRRGRLPHRSLLGSLYRDPSAPYNTRDGGTVNLVRDDMQSSKEMAHHFELAVHAPVKAQKDQWSFVARLALLTIHSKVSTRLQVCPGQYLFLTG